jgi:UDP-N-acetylmuramate dehydrogenase
MIIDFSKFSSIKIGPKIEVKEIDEFNYDGERVIGGATNVLISPNATNLGILKDEYKFLKMEKGYLKVGAKTKNVTLYNFCKKNDLGGFEFLSQLPGSVGGAVKMNAGVKNYEISANLIAVKTLKGWIEKKDLAFSYRNSSIQEPIFEIVFELKKGFDPKLDEKLKNLRKNQPKQPSLGSVFKNPPNDYAGRLIEKAGLKGLKKGGVLISPIHANFFVNEGGGTYEDMIWLMEKTKKEVFEKFGINLEPEIKII